MALSQPLLNPLYQAYADRQMQQQAYSQLSGLGFGTGTSTTTTGTTWYHPSMNLQQYQAISNPYSYATQAPAPEPKKYKKCGVLLKDLRDEIDRWHGDILRAA